MNALKSCSVTEVYPQLDGDSSEDDDDASDDDNDDDSKDDDDNDDDTGDGDTTGTGTTVKVEFFLTAVLAAAAKAFMQ